MDAATLRAERRYGLACAVFFIGAAVVAVFGVSYVSLVGSLVAMAGSITMGATAARAGA
jgi:hypothetical protein